MSTPYTRAPHQEGSNPQALAPNAALLIDFDNVTMGMRSDLSRELKSLLGSDVIKGKVTVQRAYADWRRYPQYIVPLSEASVDLIFAPAYGSSKKNATDIRMAIDALELVFIRPEIGTFILLTGDSDFSSLVLKLKEYGKYVIGVGIQESSSDILVQNCDEYYSYTSLTGLRKTTEGAGAPMDPWVLVEKAVQRMESRNDVMRSDRLKQVMLELDPGFDESNYNFSKFSKFITEAASRKLLKIRKMDNGQYEVASGGGDGRSGGGGGGESRSGGNGRGGRGRGGRGERPGRSSGRDSDAGRAERDEPARAPAAEPAPSGSGGGKQPLQAAYDLLVRVLRDLTDAPGEAVRDSDVKRKMLAHDDSFDESELGFSKFSRFLRQADDDEVVVLRKRDTGNYEVALPHAGQGGDAPPAEPEEKAAEVEEAAPAAAADEEPAPAEEADRAPAASVAPGRKLGPRRGERSGRKGAEGPPPLLPGQAVGAGGASAEGGSSGGASATGTSGGRPAGRDAPSGDGGPLDPDELGLPTDAESAVRYLSNSYSGVGEKTAETLVNALGEELFPVLHSEPERVRELVPASRADKVLEGWRTDYERRVSEAEGGDDTPEGPGSEDGSDASAETVAAGTGSESEAGSRSRGRRRTRRSRRGRGGDAG